MQEIKVNELKPHQNNDYYFDDMLGQKWTEFLESVKTSGVIEPIVCTQNKTIVSGHQRVRACKELGIQTIMCELRFYDDEDKVIKDLIETNIRQRGDVSSSSLKMGRIICELERVYGVRQGSANPKGINQYNGDSTMSSDGKTQESLMAELGMSKDTYLNYKKLTTLIPELQELVDTGTLTPSTASRVIARLSKEDQRELILTYGEEIIDGATQKQVQEYIDKIKELEHREPEIIDNTDYATINQLKNKTNNLELQVSNLEKEKGFLERRAKLNQEEADKYNKLKSDIEFLNQQKSDLARQLYSATELAELTVKLQKVLENDLSPIKYKRCIDVLDNSEVAVENLKSIVTSVEKWLYEIQEYLTNSIHIEADLIEI